MYGRGCEGGVYNGSFSFSVTLKLVLHAMFASRRLQRLHIPPIGVLSDSMCAAMIQGVVDVFCEKRVAWVHHVCNGQNRLFTVAFTVDI